VARIGLDISDALKARYRRPKRNDSHEPVVDEDIFAQVQQVLREHDKYRQRTQRHKYLLRGLLYSLDAGSPCWAETHLNKGISYYRSSARVNGSQIFYNAR